MIDRLKTDPVLRRRTAYAATLVALAVATQFLFPGSDGPGRGTPFAILFQGLVLGLTTSLFAVGVVLIYRTMRFINFAQGVLGAIGTTLISYLIVFTPVPFPAAFILGIGVAGLVGVVVGILLLRFFNSSRLFLTVVTIAGSLGLIALSQLWVPELPFWPQPEDLTTAQLNDLAALSDNMPMAGLEFQVGDLPIQFGFAHLFAIEMSILALAGVWIFLSWTRAGTAVRAMAENPERASLLGIGVGGLSVVVWGIAGMLDGLAGFLSVTAAPDVGSGFRALLIPFAAAVLARFRDVGPTVLWAVVLGIVKTAFGYSFDENASAFDAILFLVILGGLFVQRRQLSRSESGAAVSWSATDEPRPIPRELASLPVVRVTRIALIALAGLVVVAFPFAVSTSQVVLLQGLIVTALAVLSLVVLTGWAGQVSLGQFALVAVGAVVGGSLTTKLPIPFWLAIPLTMVVTALVALIIGIPALRVRGLFLLVTTFAFAAVVQSLLFNDRYFGWLLPGNEIRRPTLFILDFEDETSMYYLCVVALVLAILAIMNLRRGRIGRVLIALRENEENVRAFGVSPTRAKLQAFMLSGAIAGLAGVLYAHQAGAIVGSSFAADQSVFIFAMAVIGGVSSPVGALLGAAYFTLGREFINNPIFEAFYERAGILIVLFAFPGGLIAVVNSVRDAVLRIVAQRRQIVVPSLFADYDPDVLERQLIPLGEPEMSSGLSAVAADQRFALASDLYIGAGERLVDRLGPRRVSRDTAALGAAAAAAVDDERGRESNGHAENGQHEEGVNGDALRRADDEVMA